MNGTSLLRLLGVILAVALLVGGVAATTWGYRSAQACHERWDDVPDTYAECEDFLFIVTVYGGAVVGAVGATGLGYAAWRRRSGAAQST